MGKIYAAPDTIKTPSWDVDDWKKEEERYVEEVRKYCSQFKKDEYNGKIAQFSIADGYAEYMVISIRPLEMIHLETGDGYQYPHIERLNANDIKANINFFESLKNKQ